MRILPPIVSKLLNAHEGWIVGSAANPKAKLDNLRDLDLIIPFSHWQQAAMLIPKDATPNTFGGWKFKESHGYMSYMWVDVWPADLAYLFTNAMMKYAWHFRSGVRIVKL